MTIQFMDNFQQYGTDESFMLDGIYASVSGTLNSDPDGISPGKTILLNGSYALRKVLSTDLTTVGSGFRVWFPELPDGNSNAIFQWRDNANAVQCTLSIMSTGGLQFWRGDFTTLLGTSATPVVTAGAWHHIEVKALIDDTAGTLEVRVNGRVIIDLDTIDTKATSIAGCAQVVWGDNSISSERFYMKDVIVWDSLGSSNNDFIGDVQIVSLIPTGDTALNWTPSTGTDGYALIDESVPNDTDYISADDTLPDASVFTLSDLDADVVSVKGLMSFVRMFKTDGGTAQVQVGLVSGTNTDNGEDRPITVAETTWMDLSELDPDTAAAWTPIAVNAVKLRIDRTV